MSLIEPREAWLVYKMNLGFSLFNNQMNAQAEFTSLLIALVASLLLFPLNYL